MGPLLKMYLWTSQSVAKKTTFLIMTDALTQIETFRTSPQEVSIVVCMQQTMCALSSVSNDDTFGVHWQIQSKVYRCNQSSAPQRNIAKTLDFDANM